MVTQVKVQVEVEAIVEIEEEADEVARTPRVEASTIKKAVA